LNGSEHGSGTAGCDKIWTAKVWVAAAAVHYLQKTVFSVPQTHSRE